MLCPPKPPPTNVSNEHLTNIHASSKNRHHLLGRLVNFRLYGFTRTKTHKITYKYKIVVECNHLFGEEDFFFFGETGARRLKRGVITNESKFGFAICFKSGDEKIVGVVLILSETKI